LFNSRECVCGAMGRHGAAAIADSGQMVQRPLIKMDDLRYGFAAALPRVRRLMHAASGRKYPQTGPQDREEKVISDICGVYGNRMKRPADHDSVHCLMDIQVIEYLNILFKFWFPAII